MAGSGLRMRTPAPRLLLMAVALVVALTSALPAHAQELTLVSQDPYKGGSGQHKTEVEPDTVAYGKTVVSVFQVARIFDGGAMNIGWSTSLDGGATWNNGFMPGITTVEGGIYPRVSDPSVAYDAKHGVWMASSLALVEGPVRGREVVLSRSSDGLSWDNPVTVYLGTSTQNLDKNWTACDNSPTSPHLGTCYTTFDDNADGDRLKMTRSIDGGLTWDQPVEPQGRPTGLGGEPVVQADGTVIVPAANASETAIIAFRSTDGGDSWGPAVLVSVVRKSTVHGNLRTGALPSAGIDGDGTVYVMWQDCRFENPNCSPLFNQAPHDIVLSTSSDGLTWSDVVRIPIDDVGSGVDHFIPGLGVDVSTHAPDVHLALTYYYYPDWNCTPTTCQLLAGFVKSLDGGATWSAPLTLTGPMTLSWLANTSQGRMVGDYIATTFPDDGTAHLVIAVANEPVSDPFDEAMYANSSGLAPRAGTAPVRRAAERAPRLTASPREGSPLTVR